jgi:tryptophan 2,3-dioxygenase
MPAFVGLIFSKWGLYAALAIGALYVLHLHDNAVRAAMDAKATAAIAEQSAADQTRLTAAQKALAVSEKTRIAETQQLRDRVNAQTPKSGWRLACAPLGVAIDGMRRPSGPVAAPANPR